MLWLAAQKWGKEGTDEQATHIATQPELLIFCKSHSVTLTTDTLSDY